MVKQIRFGGYIEKLPPDGQNVAVAKVFVWFCGGSLPVRKGQRYGLPCTHEKEDEARTCAVAEEDRKS